MKKPGCGGKMDRSLYLTENELFVLLQGETDTSFAFSERDHKK